MVAAAKLKKPPPMSHSPMTAQSTMMPRCAPRVAIFGRVASVRNKRKNMFNKFPVNQHSPLVDPF